MASSRAASAAVRNSVNAGVLSGERDDITPADVELDGAAKGWQASLF